MPAASRPFDGGDQRLEEPARGPPRAPPQPHHRSARALCELAAMILACCPQRATKHPPYAHPWRFSHGLPIPVHCATGIAWTPGRMRLR
jgi:hypothetical protein